MLHGMGRRAGRRSETSAAGMLPGPGLVRPELGVFKTILKSIVSLGFSENPDLDLLGSLDGSSAVRVSGFCGVICLWFASFEFQAGFHNLRSSFPPCPPLPVQSGGHEAVQGAAWC